MKRKTVIWMLLSFFVMTCIFLFGNQRVTVNAASISPDYVTDNGGIYPKNGWQPTGQSDVINHQGGDEENGWDRNAGWKGNPANTKDSYLKYGTDLADPDYAIRKYAKETTTPGLYDMYLNVKGNSQRNIKPVDIVLVVDMSGSMEKEGRSQAVRNGISQFLQQINSAGIGKYVNVGLIGYSSPGSRGNHNYRNEQVAMNAVSDQSQQAQINHALEGRFNGGTFTQDGIRRGASMLNSDSSGNKKMMILLTDGVPTFSYRVKNSEKDRYDGFLYGTNFDEGRLDEPGNTSKFGRQRSNPYWDDSHNRIEDTWPATLGEAKIAKSHGTEIHTLGIQLTADNRYLSQQEVRDRTAKIASPGKYENADTADQVEDYLNRQAKDVVSNFNTIVNGEINDPLGAQFNYATEKQPTVQSVGKEQVAKLPDVQVGNNKLHVSNLNLGKDQEIQVHYQVHIATESKDFKPDHWYQMNGKTTLTPRGDEPDNQVEFGVPSAKASGVKLAINKIWHSLPGISRPDNVKFTVSRKNVVNADSWTSATGGLTVRDKWSKEFTKLNVGQDEVFLPKFNNNGQDFKYEVTSEDPVEGYIPSFNNTADKLTITNTALGFQVKKYAADSQAQLSGADFQLTKYTDNWQTKEKEQKIQGNADLSGIKPGYYTLEEVTAPKGYQLDNRVTKFQVTDKGQFLDQNGQEISGNNIPKTNGFYLDKAKEAAVLTYVQYDHLKPFNLSITKVDQDNQNKKLKDAEFELTGEGVEKTISTDQNGLAQFEGLKPGNYVLRETKAPEGYATWLKEKIELTINNDGSVKFSAGTSGNAELTTGSANNSIKLTIKDQAKGVLPKTGGPGIMNYLIVGATLILITLSAALFYLRHNKQEV